LRRFFLWGLVTWLLVWAAPVGADPGGAVPPRVVAGPAPSASPSGPAPSGPSSSADDTRVTIRRFLIEGARTQRVEALHKLVAPYENQEYSLKELNRVAQVVAAYYRGLGYFLTKAYVPVQTIGNDGVAKIQVVEALIGEVFVEGNKYRSKAQIASFFSALQRSAAPRYSEFDRAVRLLNELIGVKASAVLRPGKEPERVDVTVKVEDKNPVKIYADYNNYGNRFVGVNRAGLGYLHGNLTGNADALLVRGVSAFPSRDLTPFVQTAYTFPLNRNGTALALNYTNGATAVGEELASLDIRSRANVYGFTVTQAVVRDKDASSNLSAGFVGKSFTSFILNVPSSKDELRELFVDYSGDFSSASGKNIYSVTVSRGLGTMFGGSSVNNPLSSRPGAGDTFTKFNGAYVRIQPVGSAAFLVLRGIGQLSTDRLVVGEQFAIGGPDTVRGYAQSQVLGDYGYATTLELRAPILHTPDSDLQFAAFFDHGTVYTYSPGVGQNFSQSLTGTGFGFSGSYKNYNGKIDFGFPVSPARNATNSIPMVYVQVSGQF